MAHEGASCRSHPIDHARSDREVLGWGRGRTAGAGRDRNHLFTGERRSERPRGPDPPGREPGMSRRQLSRWLLVSTAAGDLDQATTADLVVSRGPVDVGDSRRAEISADVLEAGSV